jgi:hypothetical protein
MRNIFYHPEPRLPKLMIVAAVISPVRAKRALRFTFFKIISLSWLSNTTGLVKEHQLKRWFLVSMPGISYD